MGASHANGGQLSYSFTDALARPEFLARLPALLLGRDPGIRVHRFMGGDLWRWGINFLRQCTNKKATENTLAVLELALKSARLMEQLRQDVPLQFSFAASGKLILLDHTGQLEAAKSICELKREHGCETTLVSMSQACEIEPSLSAMQGAYAGAIHSKGDHAADSNEFTRSLKKWLEDNGGVSFLLGEQVDKLRIDGGRLRAIELRSDSLDVDAAVVCLGAWSPALLRPIGIDPQIYPVRGYSVTLPVGPSAPVVSVTDLSRRILFSRLSGNLRITGFADFHSFDTRRDHQRIDQMVDMARRIAPHAALYDARSRNGWGGFRPMTPDGRPRVGPTSVDGLFLNTGHGALGWTLACATGRDAADHVARYLS